MKKYIIIFVCFFALFLVLSRDEIKNFIAFKKIDADPAYTTVTDHTIAKRKRGKFEDIYVYFKFNVDGTEYKFRSLSTNKAGATSYVTDEKFKEVAYAKNAPSYAMLKYHYEMRKKDHMQTLSMLLVLCGGGAFIVTLILALIAFIIGRLKNMF